MAILEAWKPTTMGGKIMFVAMYEFEIKDGKEAEFREAWLEVTKAIYQHCGSLGSRLHTSDNPNVLIGYAQWPSREQWEKDKDVTDERYRLSRQTMRECLVQSRTIYTLDVCDDYLKS
ncbi:antibiotic biosynthesis monooxygenase family protein [Halomonas smyrnensis]|uniref:antibiotic biosynthesis monooxygenase family protein n=1 Tax=Halomonas smyrnensis TaxID=720605 RepID=UPI001ED9C341|nr:antibiotic biosynthesis monooxygenase [Halomonas smyrnensis]